MAGTMLIFAQENPLRIYSTTFIHKLNFRHNCWFATSYISSPRDFYFCKNIIFYYFFMETRKDSKTIMKTSIKWSQVNNIKSYRMVNVLMKKEAQQMHSYMVLSRTFDRIIMHFIRKFCFRENRNKISWCIMS